ncbi:hypothetical protein ACLUWV_04090 [Bifidobacterium thermophilum]|uniref:hypothetical protein n=1 Tax=Bifidobacterium thermophilum TaxID=33905 RepID=UPI00399583DE
MSGTTSIRRVLDAATAHGLKVRQNHADDYMMQCPLHTPDNDPSVHVTYRDGRTLICDMHDQDDKDSAGRIAEAIGLTLSDLYDDPIEAGGTRGYFDTGYDRWIREWAAKQAHRRAGERHTETIAPVVGGPYAMPAPYVPSNTLPALSERFTAICAALGIARPCYGPVWAECPVCGREGGLQVLYNPFERATLLCCLECGGGRDYADKLMDMLHVPAPDWRSNGTEIMAYDTPDGVTYTYPDGAQVHRRPDKRINSTGAAGAHPLWRSPEAARYMPGHPVFLTEGEKDAATLWANGYAAMSGIGGAGAFANRVSLDNIRGALAGATVVAVVDKDTSGLKWARQVRDRLAPVVGTLTFVQAHGTAHDTTDTVMTHDMRTEWFDTLTMPASATTPDTPGDTDTGGTPDTDTVHQADTSMDTGMGGVMDADDDGTGTRVDPDMGFWASRPYLARIRDAARATMTSPWAVLNATLCRVSTLLPPNIVVPAMIGGQPSGHNLFAATVGKSSEGKGLAEGVAARLIPESRGAVTTQPASGEALAAMFAARTTVDGEDGKPLNVLECVNCRAMLSVPEIQVLGAVMGRDASTLTGELTKAWSGETLGSRTKQKTNSIRAPRHGYVFNLIAGVQPGNAGILFNQETTGLPQRFLWADARDPYGTDPDDDMALADCDAHIDPLISDTSDMPDIGREALTALYRYGGVGDMPHGEGQREAYPLKPVRFPEAAWKETRRLRAETNRNGAPEDGSGHTNLTRLKVAMLLPWLDPDRGDRMAVTSDDWQTAGMIVRHSTKVCRQCREQWEAEAVSDAARKAHVKRAGERKAIETESDLKAQACEKALAYIVKHTRPGGRVQGRTVKQNLASKLRDYATYALLTLEKDKRIECVEKSSSSPTASWWGPANVGM